MKTQLKKEWLFWILILAPLVLVMIKWNDFPDRIPMHWNIDGEIDDYGGKWALFLSPGINLAMYFLMMILPKIDPRAKNYDLFGGVFFTIRIALTVLLSMIGIIVCLASLHVAIDVAMIIQLSVIGLFIILGNSFGKIRPNYFVGLRTPWTLNNEEVWMKAHRFTGKLWVICGLALVPAVFLLEKHLFVYVFIAVIFTMVLVPIIYSWAVHKKITRENSH